MSDAAPRFTGGIEILADDPETWLSALVAANGLQITMRTSLARNPGSSHWHLKKPGQTGVLEVTWSPKDKRTWFKVAKNRSAVWIDAVVAEWGR